MFHPHDSLFFEAFSCGDPIGNPTAKAELPLARSAVDGHPAKLPVRRRHR
jgi:hypothetical protein